MKRHSLYILLLLIISRAETCLAQNFRSIDINTGFSGSSPAQMVEYNGKLYFTATDSAHGGELWVTEGTYATTHLVKDIYQGTGYSNIQDFAVSGNKLFFFAIDYTHGYELWVSDGTTAGTNLVKDIRQGAMGSYDYNALGFKITPMGNKVYFSADDSVHGSELWVSDGTDSGTYMVKDLYPGSNGSYPESGYFFTKSIIFQNKLYFSAYDDTHGRELWVSDGTDTGTYLLSDVSPGPTSSSPSNIFLLDSTLLFFAFDSILGFELWRSDGAGLGTYLIRAMQPTPPAINYYYSSGFTYYRGKAYWGGDDGVHGAILWRTDGTNTGTELVSNVNTDIIGPGPGYNEFITFHDRLYFPVQIDSFHYASVLGVSDGTDTGTTVFKILAKRQSQYYGPTNFMIYNDHLFFVSPDDSSSDFKLWISDGTEAGTFTIHPSGSNKIDPLNYGAPLIVFNNDLYICANFDSIGNELWIYHYDSTTVNSIGYVSGNQNLKAFPNPFHNSVTISGLDRSDIYHINFFDTNGKLIHSFDSGHGLEQFTLDLQETASGIYILQITGQNDNAIFKMIRQ